LAADKKADSSVHSRTSGKTAVTAAVAVVGVAGIAATAIALSSQTGAHAGAQPVNPARTTTTHTAGKAVRAKRTQTPSRKVHTVSKRSPSAKPHATLDTYRKSAAAQTRWFTVESGDSLSSISGYVYGNDNDWPVLYYANENSISSPNDISVGQTLRVPALPATIPAAPASATESTSSASSDYSQTASSASSGTASTDESDSSDDANDYSGFQACVISRESDGDSQAMNSSGHYGLYQFSQSTWDAYGGNPSDFGDASVAEQNQVFDNAMADGGESNWAPYDGC
jgi:resuscitation-promoting factor RpfB